MAQTKRQKFEILRSQLDSERSSFLAHWRDLGEYILPRRPRWFTSDANKGDRRNQKIIDSTATMAARTLRSGMMGGVTSPARPWFRLTTPDPDLAEFGAVKDWLHIVSNRMSTVYLRSNLYNMLPIIYGDIGVFGTGAMAIEEDFSDDVIRTSAFPIGSYWIANSEKLKVDVFYREFRMTVRQLIQRFGKVDLKTGAPEWEAFSDYVKAAWDRGEYETWIDVCHVIMPNEDYKEGALLAKEKKYLSCYFERGTTTTGLGSYLRGDGDRYLSESGYDYFPILCPRWETTGEDVYGTDCPGMTAIGDIKALQTMQKRKAQAIEKMVNPPMVGPTSLRNAKASILPGDITYQDVREGQMGFRPAHEVNFRVNEIMMDIQDHQKRVSRAFFEDLFLMLANSDRRQITAREIEERHEEKLLALGPVLEQLNQDLLDPLIENTFEIMMRQDILPPPPDELQGVKLKVEYISVMAQAQKLVGLAGVERFMSFASQIAQVNPASLDKIDTDQALDVYADITSIPPGIVRPDDQVQAMRDQKEQAAKQQQMQQMVMQGAGAAKDLSQASMDGDNALTRLLGQANAGSITPGI